MSEDERYARLATLGQEIENLGNEFSLKVKEYMNGFAATGFNPPTPPRPRRDVLIRVSESADWLSLSIKLGVGREE
jgi:hypothetical protein